MLRYYLIATVLVVGALAIGAHAQHRRAALQVRGGASATGTPSSARAQGPASFAPGDVRGEAPWALSALPGCFEQESVRRGGYDAVLRHLPSTARPIREMTLLAGDCVLRVRTDDATVTRSGDVLHLPRPTALFWVGRELALLHRSGARGELRMYRIK